LADVGVDLGEFFVHAFALDDARYLIVEIPIEKTIVTENTSVAALIVMVSAAPSEIFLCPYRSPCCLVGWGGIPAREIR
jgi:hypothetical protein